MNIQTEVIKAEGIKFSYVEGVQEVARAYLYLMHNDLHQEPFGLLEDVYVSETQRGTGIGTKIVQQVIKTAKQRGCYKLIATSRTSRSRVHQLYKKIGFTERGLEFRIDF